MFSLQYNIGTPGAKGAAGVPGKSFFSPIKHWYIFWMMFYIGLPGTSGLPGPPGLPGNSGLPGLKG